MWILGTVFDRWICVFWTERDREREGRKGNGEGEGEEEETDSGWGIVHSLKSCKPTRELVSFFAYKRYKAIGRLAAFFFLFLFLFSCYSFLFLSYTFLLS